MSKSDINNRLSISDSTEKPTTKRIKSKTKTIKAPTAIDYCECITQKIEVIANQIGIANLGWQNSKIKDTFLDKNSWNEFSQSLREQISEGCNCHTFGADELDKFWQQNRTFIELKDYICENC